MWKKIICAFICMLLLATIVPTMSALPCSKVKKKNTIVSDDVFPSGIYTRCYVEASGTFESSLAVRFIRVLNFASAALLFIRFNDDAETTIYADRNKEDELWHHEGALRLNLVRYLGYYYFEYSDDDTKTLTIFGRAVVANPKT